jgi:hypothetical protein
MDREWLFYVIAALVHCFGQTYGEGLEAKLAGAKLPRILCQSKGVYDGIDSVFIFGG